MSLRNYNGEKKTMGFLWGEYERERSQTRDRCTCSLTESMTVRGYCAKLPEDKRVNTEPLLWSFCRSLRDKRAGAGFPPSLPPARPGSPSATPERPTVPTHLLQESRTGFCARTSRRPKTRKPPWVLTERIWPQAEVRRSIGRAETSLCSNSRHVSAPACFPSAQQWLWSARARVLQQSLWGS